MASPIIEEHVRSFNQEEIKRIRAILTHYNEFRLEVSEILIALAGERLVPSRLPGLRKTLNELLAASALALTKESKASLELAVSQGVTHVGREINFFEKKLTGQGRRLQLEANTILGRVNNLLIDQYRSSIARYSEHLRGRISRTLAESALKKESLDQVVKNLSSTKGLVNKEKYQLERIARTEFNNAYNQSRLQSIRDAKKILPDLKKRWDAYFDSRTSDICKSLDGKIVNDAEDFTYAGDTFQAPPAHPNCRSIVVPYRDVWKHYFN